MARPARGVATLPVGMRVRRRVETLCAPPVIDFKDCVIDFSLVELAKNLEPLSVNPSVHLHWHQNVMSNSVCKNWI
jgi:hypothetical protein